MGLIKDFINFISGPTVLFTLAIVAFALSLYFTQVWSKRAGIILLAIWTNRQVHRKFSLRRLAGLPEINRARPDSFVVRGGIYARVRHPRYLEFILSFLGLAFLTGAVGIFLLAFVSILLYLVVAPLEERELRESYGAEYEAYARAVPRFLPHLWQRDKSQTSS